VVPASTNPKTKFNKTKTSSSILRPKVRLLNWLGKF
jgi:hypothetical protein